MRRIGIYVYRGPCGSNISVTISSQASLRTGRKTTTGRCPFQNRYTGRCRLGRTGYVHSEICARMVKQRVQNCWGRYGHVRPGRRSRRLLEPAVRKIGTWIGQSRVEVGLRLEFTALLVLHIRRTVYGNRKITTWRSRGTAICRHVGCGKRPNTCNVVPVRRSIIFFWLRPHKISVVRLFDAHQGEKHTRFPKSVSEFVGSGTGVIVVPSADNMAHFVNKSPFLILIQRCLREVLWTARHHQNHLSNCPRRPPQHQLHTDP